MFIILVMVMSANGKITSGENTRLHDWTSPEDQKYFAKLIEKSELVIMGRKTFLSAKPLMTLSTKTLRVVLTKKPKRYFKLSMPGQLEFTKEPPHTLVKNLEKRGYKQALLVGGAEINTAFLNVKLVNEMWLTVEPVILGNGKNLFSEKGLSSSPCLQLKSRKKLNGRGTLLLKYTVIR